MAKQDPSSFDLATLREGLGPFRLHFFRSLRSTSDHAAAMRRRGELFAPAVVLAGRQTAGRGRATNTWFSSRGSITVTFALPVDPALAPQHVPLVAGLAARNAAATVAGCPDIQLKWPNDLVVAGESRGALRKIAGLLCERMDNIDLVGLGLNVHRAPRVPRELAERIAFLQELGPGSPLTVTGVLIAVAREIHQMLVRKTQTPFGLILREYDQHHALLGRMLTVFVPHEPPVVGRCQGLDDTGRLLVKVGRRTVPIVAGHVEVGGN